MKSILLYITLSLCTVLSHGQQFPDRHSTSNSDAWLSCTTSANPNTDRGESHWIRYDLGTTYVLGTVTLWNYNNPLNLDNGVKDIAIDVSSDGITWTEAGTTTVNISEGSAFYEGEDILELGGVSADYLLITVLNNHGGSCSGFSELKVATALVLPIELSKQEAKCVSDDDAVMIAWQTVSEVGNDYFTIQKSENAVDWIDLAELSAKGVSGEGSEYNYLDKDISGVHYYRIVNTDWDGQLQYFDAMAVNCNEPSNISLSVVNPFTENLVFSYSSKESSDILYSVKSLDGKEILAERSYGGTNVLTIPSSEWIPGTYVITIKQDEQIITKKVIKM